MITEFYFMKASELVILVIPFQLNYEPLVKTLTILSSIDNSNH